MSIKITKDPFGELEELEKCAGLKQRFDDRVLIMTTNDCFERCEHCTRRWILGNTPVVDTPERLAACVDYIKWRPRVRDVLLSGGDVLTLSDEKVAEFVDAFAALEQIEIIRICTRALVTKPERITPELVEILARSKKVWVNCHINTADEAMKARAAAAKLIDRGIPVSSQTVLLKGINDTRNRMYDLLRSLSAARIRPYYVFQCDPVSGIHEKFAVPLEKAKKIERYCAENLGGLALPRFVVDQPNSRRKMPLDLLAE